MKVNLDKRIVCMLFLYLHFFVAFLNAQDEQSFNYASLNSTIISAEYLDEKMIKGIVDNNLDWNDSWRENDWYYFKFEQLIYIDTVELAFYDAVCFSDWKLAFELITKDTIIDITINRQLSSYKLNCQTDYLILKRKNIYARCNGHINEIKLLSNTVPKSMANGNPNIRIDKETRLSIKYSMQGLSKSEIKDESKLWKKRKKFIKHYLKNKLKQHEIDFFVNRIFYGNDENWFCYKVSFHLDNLSYKSLAVLFDDCKCDVREKFFESKMKPTQEMMKRDFVFRDEKISYYSKNAEGLLAKSLEVGDNYASEAIPHICLMGKDKYIDKIYALKDHEDDFTKVQAINGLLYFDKYKKALEIAQQIQTNEIASLKKDSISAYGYFAVNSLIIMNEYYPSKILSMMLELYKEYSKVYQRKKMSSEGLPDGKYFKEISNNMLEVHTYEDRLILNYIESYISKYPHLMENEILREFKKYIDISKQTDKLRF